jgi:hypothetical protein
MPVRLASKIWKPVATMIVPTVISLRSVLLFEVDGLAVAAGFHAGLFALAGLELDAGSGRIDQGHRRDGLRERQEDGFALAEAEVEFVAELRLLVDARLDALLAAGAEVLQHVTRFAA